MTKEEIINITKDFLSEEFEVDAELITPNNNFHETLELDSLDYVDLVVVIQDNFGFKATADDFKAISTFEDFFNLVEKKIA